MLSTQFNSSNSSLVQAHHHTTEPTAIETTKPDLEAMKFSAVVNRMEAAIKTMEFMGTLNKLFPEILNEKEPLIRLVHLIDVEGANEEIKKALIKQEGYLSRFFSDESWGDWVEDKTDLGTVVSLFADYATSTTSLEHFTNRLDSQTIRAANQEASQLLSRIEHQEDLSLRELYNQSSHEIKNRKEKILQEFGSRFTELVGFERIEALPVVNAEDIGLIGGQKYPGGQVKPYLMNGQSAVRGVMKDTNRPFIAIKIQMKDPETLKILGTVVEVIFKRYSNDRDSKLGEWHENNWVTALSNADNYGNFYRSTLYRGGGMSKKQMEGVRDLLDGKEIHSVSGAIPDYLIQMV